MRIFPNLFILPFFLSYFGNLAIVGCHGALYLAHIQCYSLVAEGDIIAHNSYLIFN